MYYDDQEINGPQAEGSVFTLADQAELRALADKYAGGDLVAMENDNQHIKAELNKAQGSGSKAIKLREWLESHPMPSADEVENLMRLRDKAFHAKHASIDADRYDAIMASVEQRLITKESAQRTVAVDGMKALDAAFELANGMIMKLGMRERLANEYPEATMTQEEMDSAMSAFGEYEQWEKTKEAFRARYEACESITEKTNLRAMFPELAAAAL